ncbi:conserved hypothetical protein [Rhodoferax ferrireducens T118]|uniref:Uncharacterized protein n=1 Tax=Albidiferax ferrireducens (strain ATCC BAA-621 / DSM 15236 / T118) TaxID=338969 RepID=Q21QX7_ALBFT|nr:group III truncated hemoglobin [Rhodoferax ferrireducens]ABD71826.1 conserved hypothetical protein [Rhodoferax ferrireducens T118]
MPSADLCTEEEIIQLVNRFYAGVRKHEVPGPIVNPHVKDRDTHLSTMGDFWSSPLRGSARFRGAPMPMPEHTALPSRNADKLAGVA